MTFDVDQSFLQGVNKSIWICLVRSVESHDMRRYFTRLMDYFILERDTDILFSDVLVDDIRNIFVDEYVFDWYMYEDLNMDMVEDEMNR